MQTRYVRLEHTAASPCRQCGATYHVRGRTRSLTQAFCSIDCKQVAQRKDTTKRCVQCDKELPYEKFPMYYNRIRAKSCEDCLPRRETPERPLQKSRKPCLTCNQHFYMRCCPSEIKRRRYCGRACAVAAMTKRVLTCTSCKRALPADDFDYQPSGKTRATTCKGCVDERNRLKAAGLGYRISYTHMAAVAKGQATKARLKFNVSEERIVEIFNSPCSLCGAPTCCMRPNYPELDYTDDNVDGVCWPCNIFKRGRDLQMSDELVIEHARAIVKWADS